MSDDLNEQQKREFLIAHPDILARASELYDALTASMNSQKKYGAMTNAQLADEIINGPWAETPIFGAFSDLLDEVVGRLRNVAARRWIPVSERLPEENLIVPVAIAGHPVIWLGYRHNGSWYGQESGRVFMGLTHWWDISEPPKEQE